MTLGAPASGVILERNVSEGSRFDRGDALWVIGDIEIRLDYRGSLSRRHALCCRRARRHRDPFRTARSLRRLSIPRCPALKTTDACGKAALDSEKPYPPSASRNDRYRHSCPAAPVEGLTVPVDAVIESGIRPRVFVRRSDGSLESRAVIDRLAQRRTPADSLRPPARRGGGDGRRIPDRFRKPAAMIRFLVDFSCRHRAVVLGVVLAAAAARRLERHRICRATRFRTPATAR